MSTFAGSGTAGGGNGIGSSAQFNNPIDVSIASNGLFAVSSCYLGHCIRHIALSTRLVTTIGGDGSTGHVNGVGTNSRFNNPAGVSLYSSDSRALVGDRGNHRVRLIDMSSLQATTVAGSGTAGGANGIGISATFASPLYIAVSSNDEFAVVSEYHGHRLRKVVLSTWAVSTLAGSPSSATGSFDGVGTLATFNRPYGVVLTSDDVYVYVSDRLNHKIRRVEISSRRVVTLVGQAGSTALSQPIGVTWLTLDSVLLVSNAGSHRILQMYGTCAAPTSSPTRIPTSGPSIYTAPEGLFCDEVSQVVVAGTGSTGSANGVGISASFNGPHGIATFPDGSFVLITDYYNHKIRKLVVSTGSVSTFAGSGTAGGGNGIGSSAQFNNPNDVTIASNGLFAVTVCALGHRIRHIVLSTHLVTTIGGDGSTGHVNGIGTNSRFHYPIGISLHSSDSRALVGDANNNRVRLIDMSSLQATTVVGSGTAGGANGIGTSATFNNPRFIAVSSNDEFAVVSEQSGHRIRKVVLSTWAVSTLAGSPSSATGSFDGVGTLATFHGPNGLLLTSDDAYVYMSDRLNHKIRRVEISSRRVVTLVGQAGSTALSQPIGVTWLTLDSVLLMSNAGSHRILQMYGTCAAPTSSPTSGPSVPSATPTCRPISLPTSTLSGEPSGVPTGHPSSESTFEPSGIPTGHPSSEPTFEPSGVPTGHPSSESTFEPSGVPTGYPSSEPTFEPSGVPTGHPSSESTFEPSVTPTSEPSELPTSLPTSTPSGEPSGVPTGHPSSEPTFEPSGVPTGHPSSESTFEPSGVPTGHPSSEPIFEPSVTPTSEPSEPPTSLPTSSPSGEPSGVPTGYPSTEWSLQPSICLPSSPLPTVVPTPMPLYFSTLKAYGGSRGDYVTSIAVSPSDWGSVLAGYDIGRSAAAYDAYLVKLDRCGEMMWSVSYGGPLVDSIQKVSAAHDGDMVFVGDWTNPTSSRVEVLLGRLNPNSGDLIRVLSFSLIDKGASRGMGLVLNDDGSVLIGGTASSASHSRALVLLVEFSGNIIWSLALQGDAASQSYYFNDATRLVNGDFVMVGHGSVSSTCVSIMSRVSANGERRRTSQWGVKGSDKAYSIARCRDGGYVIASASRDHTPTGAITLLRFDLKDRLLWAVSIDSNGHDMPSRIIVTHDNGLVVVGSTAINSFGANKGCLIKLNSTGHMEWARGYGKGTNYRDHITDMVELPGGGYRATG